MTVDTEPQQQAPPAAIPTPQLIAAMLQGRENVSDLIFSPGRAPQVELNGQLVELKFRGLEKLTPAHTSWRRTAPPIFPMPCRPWPDFASIFSGSAPPTPS